MKKSLIMITFLLISSHTYAQQSGSLGTTYFPKTPEQANRINTADVESDLKKMISDIDNMIEKAVTARHMYKAVMGPAQDLVAMCKSASSRKSRTKKARELFKQRCDDEKQQLKSRLYEVAGILEETKAFEKDMNEEAKALREIISVSEGFDALKPSTDKMNAAIKDLQNIRQSIERQMEEDVGE